MLYASNIIFRTLSRLSVIIFARESAVVPIERALGAVGAMGAPRPNVAAPHPSFCGLDRIALNSHCLFFYPGKRTDQKGAPIVHKRIKKLSYI
jgi:hypothetical protein